MSRSQQAKAEALRALHTASHPLLLVNAWDAASARIIEELGFPAIATTSAGIAWAEGFADGEQISRADMLARVEHIARVVDAPLSADLEGAYGDTIDDAAATARGAIQAGAVGLNFEDAKAGGGGLIDIDAQAARVAAMREVANQLGVVLVINARTDVFLADIGDDDAWRLAEATRRGNRYFEAGADCVFVPGVTDEGVIRELVGGLRGPLNVLAGANLPPVKRLGELGVARVSLGSGAMACVLAEFRELAQRLEKGGDFKFLSRRISHSAMNELFSHI